MQRRSVTSNEHQPAPPNMGPDFLNDGGELLRIVYILHESGYHSYHPRNLLPFLENGYTK